VAGAGQAGRDVCDRLATDAQNSVPGCIPWRFVAFGAGGVCAAGCRTVPADLGSLGSSHSSWSDLCFPGPRAGGKGGLLPSGRSQEVDAGQRFSIGPGRAVSAGPFLLSFNDDMGECGRRLAKAGTH
jgi:hypothetical protein